MARAAEPGRLHQLSAPGCRLPRGLAVRAIGRARSASLMCSRTSTPSSPGEDFVDVITTAVRSCHTMLVVIGPKWLGMIDKRGARRIDDPNDFIRLPSSRPRSRTACRSFPSSFSKRRCRRPTPCRRRSRRFARRHAIEISSTRFKSDVARLIHAVERQRRARQAPTCHSADSCRRPGASPALPPTPNQQPRPGCWTTTSS